MSIIIDIALAWGALMFVTYLWIFCDTLYYRTDLPGRWKAVKEAFTAEE